MLTKVRIYVGAVLRHWVYFVTSGAAAAVFAIVVNARGVQISSWWYVAIFVCGGPIVAGFKAWEERREEALSVTGQLAELRQGREREVGELRAQLDDCRQDLRARPLGPKLALRFDPKDPLCMANLGGDEIFRVLVVNDGDRRASNVSVVLDAIEPYGHPLLNKRFSVMTSESEVFDVSPSHGRVYVDVLFQRRHASYKFIQIPRLKGATWFERQKEVTLVLRLDAEVPAEHFELRFVADDGGHMRPVLA